MINEIIIRAVFFNVDIFRIVFIFKLLLSQNKDVANIMRLINRNVIIITHFWK